ncbi:hypothetical protein ACFVSN_30745 [Kitasatospora sp. NPDC057904]|uniref:hypothetical protein n=1 Tax=Kitasatospora sp. NPDC057904 TaxID=3346275 RepID=UPI0036D852E8
MDATAAAPADPAVQRSIDAPPAKGKAKILGIADVAGTSVILAIRNDTCQVAFLPDGATVPTTAALASIGSQRPAAGSSADIHVEFLGSVLVGKYTQATGQMVPFKFTTIGCGEKSMAVKIEGAGDSASVQKKSGDSLRFWRTGSDVMLAAGALEAIHPDTPSTSTSS